MAFEQEMTWRTAEYYADFFHPHLQPDDHVLDVGCGTGTITVGLAKYVPNGTVVGIDIEDHEFQEAQTYLSEKSIENVHFRKASMLDLPFEPETFSACLCHSSIEAVNEPIQALQEIRRVLKPDGLIGVACVEYEGVLLAGPQESLLRQFYDVREKLWQLDGLADPRRGKHLRGLLSRAGYADINVQATYISHSSKAEIADFGTGRAADCEDPWYVEGALKHGLLTEEQLQEIQAAWKQWSTADDSFAAFTWCKATGRKI
ncbi:MAG: methyltransferase domain-containing protein [Chloroflexota bacterium]